MNRREFIALLAGAAGAAAMFGIPVPTPKSKTAAGPTKYPCDVCGRPASRFVVDVQEIPDDPPFMRGVRAWKPKEYRRGCAQHSPFPGRSFYMDGSVRWHVPLTAQTAVTVRRTS